MVVRVDLVIVQLLSVVMATVPAVRLSATRDALLASAAPLPDTAVQRKISALIPIVNTLLELVTQTRLLLAPRPRTTRDPRLVLYRIVTTSIIAFRTT